MDAQIVQKTRDLNERNRKLDALESTGNVRPFYGQSCLVPRVSITPNTVQYKSYTFF